MVTLRKRETCLRGTVNDGSTDGTEPPTTGAPARGGSRAAREDDQ